jgi:sodium transport system permease protein
VLRIPEEMLTGLQSILTGEGPLRLAWLIFVVAVTPAFCEEIVFRGVLLQGFLRKMPAHLAILASSFVFGVFHLSFETAIRLLPSMFLGALLAIVVTRTRSIFPSMLMHFVNNAMAVLLVSVPTLQRFVLADSGNPKWILLPLGAVLLTAGFLLLPSIKGPDSPTSESDSPEQTD